MTDLLLERPAHRALRPDRAKAPAALSCLYRPGRSAARSSGCDQRIDPARLMCRTDWRLVPYEIRGRIWAPWRSGEAAFSPKHQRVVHEAIAFVQAARSALGDCRKH